MEMEVMMSSPAVDFVFDFNFNSKSVESMSACTSPYISAPSSPPKFGGTTTPFFSAPTSPSRSAGVSPSSAVPFHWESRPGIPKTTTSDDNNPDFAFDFGVGFQEKSSLPADELFHGGKIKPLKPPPRLSYESKPADHHSPKSPRSSPKKMFKEAFSPKHKNRDFDPFAAALENTTRLESKESAQTTHHQRGRERTRSLSPPLRVSDLLFDQEKSSSSNSSSSTSSSSTTSWYKKWKLKDLLLFRSSSEGRAIRNSTSVSINKYAMLKKSSNQEEDVKNSSFRSTDSVGSVCSSRIRSGPISAHELHYTTNRAASEEMKRKTFLPYKQGLLGCLGFSPAVHEISRGLGSMNRP